MAHNKTVFDRLKGDLLLLTQLEKNHKLIIHQGQLFVQKPPIIMPERLSRWLDNQGAVQTCNHINMVVDSCIELLDERFNSLCTVSTDTIQRCTERESTQFAKQIEDLLLFYNLLEQSIIGIKNLSVTYSSPDMERELTSIENRISAFTIRRGHRAKQLNAIFQQFCGNSFSIKHTTSSVLAASSSSSPHVSLSHPISLSIPPRLGEVGVISTIEGDSKGTQQPQQPKKVVIGNEPHPVK